MADKGPSALTAADTLDGTEVVHVVQGGNSRKATTADIAGLTSGIAISDVTGLQTALDNKIDDSQADAGGLAVLSAADAAAVRAAAGVIIGTDVQAQDDQLDDIAALSYASNALKVVRVNAGETAFELATPTGTGDMLSTNNLSDLADEATARQNLGVEIGVDVQAYDADLATYAGITPSANVQSVLGAANYAAIKTLLGLVIGTDIPARSPSIQSVTSAATVTPTFADDQVNITAQAAGLTLANPTGTAVPAWGLVIRIKDNGTARAISYGTQYRAMGVTLPTTTVVSKTLYLGCIWNSTDTKFDVVSVAQEA